MNYFLYNVLLLYFYFSILPLWIFTFKLFVVSILNQNIRKQDNYIYKPNDKSKCGFGKSNKLKQCLEYGILYTLQQ